METLEELRKKFSNLDEERNAVYEKILRLEQQEITNNFVIGECYLNPYCESFKKIIAINEGVLYCVVIDSESIQRDFYNLPATKYWKKITSEQFKDIYQAVLKDIQDPDLESKDESNWDITLEAIKKNIDNKQLNNSRIT